MRVALFPDFSTYRYLQYLQIQTRYWQIPTGNSDKIPTDSTVGNKGICKYMHVSVGIYHYFENTYKIPTLPTYSGYLSVSDNYLWVFSEWELYVQVKLAVCLRKDSGSPSEAHSHRFGFILIHFSSGKGRVVIGPDHGPHVDVEQGTYTTGSGDGRYMLFVPIWPWQWWAECTSSECT